MDAALLFPTFHRLLRGLRVLPGRPHGAGARARQPHGAGLAPATPVRPAEVRQPERAAASSRPAPQAPAQAAPVLAPRALAPRPLPIPVARSAGAAVAPIDNSAAARSLRTLEEVRADLARLREQAKKRHSVEVQIRRDNSFAPTDFMDFGRPSPAAKTATPEAPFASTDFLDFTVLKSPRP